MEPTLFIAEKTDPSKGPTLTADNLDKLKTDIDNTLSYAISINVNIWDGPEQNEVLQNPKTQIKSWTHNCIDTFAIVIESSYDIDIVIEMFERRTLRKSKKHRKTRRPQQNILKIMYRNQTIFVR